MKTKRMRLDMKWKEIDTDYRPNKIGKQVIEINGIEKKGLSTYRPNPKRTHKPTYNINITGKLGRGGMPIRRGWH